MKGNPATPRDGVSLPVVSDGMASAVRRALLEKGRSPSDADQLIENLPFFLRGADVARLLRVDQRAARSGERSLRITNGRRRKIDTIRKKLLRGRALLKLDATSDPLLDDLAALAAQADLAVATEALSRANARLNVIDFYLAECGAKPVPPGAEKRKDEECLACYLAIFFLENGWSVAQSRDGLLANTLRAVLGRDAIGWTRLQAAVHAVEDLPRSNGAQRRYVVPITARVETPIGVAWLHPDRFLVVGTRELLASMSQKTPRAMVE